MDRDINLPKSIVNQIVQSITAVIPTDSIYVFGSYARGEETHDSDIDIYVLTNKCENTKIDYEGAADVGMALLWLKKPKDIICLSKDEFIRRSNRKTGLERIVAREGVKIYGN